MKTKISVAAVTLTMIATALVGAASAQSIPEDGLAVGNIGPRPLDNCEVPQERGFNGNSDGSAGGTGANGYHSYANDPSGIILDSCLSGTDVAAWPGCASGEAQNDVTVGLGEIQAGVLAQNVDLILQGVNTITTDASNFYQNECGGLLGTGTDGEFEYGTLAAALNVREGPGPGNKGDGTDSCIGPRSTAHHDDDTTVYVEDLVLGAGVGFSVSADWARPAGLSNDGSDRNSRDDRPDISHCGDGAIEPCSTGTAYRGWRNDVLVGGTTPTIPPNPTDPAKLLETLDVVFGCNPLDVTAYQAPGGLTGPNSWTVPDGGILASWGNGGASGWLLVSVQTQVVPGVANAPVGTVGWIWTG